MTIFSTRLAHDKLLDCLPGLLTNSSNSKNPIIHDNTRSEWDTPLNKADFPMVQFWEYMWNDKKGEYLYGKLEDDVRLNTSKKYMFIQDKDGTYCTVHQAKHINHLLCQMYNQWASSGPLLRKTSGANRRQWCNLYDVIYTNFPQVRHCEGHWKLGQLFKHTYPAWFRDYVKAQGSIDDNKDEDTGHFTDSQANMSKPTQPAKKIPKDKGKKRAIDGDSAHNNQNSKRKKKNKVKESTMPDSHYQYIATAPSTSVPTSSTSRTSTSTQPTQVSAQASGATEDAPAPRPAENTCTQGQILYPIPFTLLYSR